MLWLRLIVDVSLGAWLDWRFFFSVVREQRVPTAKRMSAFIFIYGTSSSLKELWASKEELRVRSSIFEKMKKMKLFWQVHNSHSVSKSCRMRILRLVSKSQRSCFSSEVSSDYWSELGNPLNSKWCFSCFCHLFAPARALLHVLYYPSHTHVFATYLSSLPPLTHLFSLLFCYLWCAPLPPCL